MEISLISSDESDDEQPSSLAARLAARGANSGALAASTMSGVHNGGSDVMVLSDASEDEATSSKAPARRRLRKASEVSAKTAALATISPRGPRAQQKAVDDRKERKGKAKAGGKAGAAQPDAGTLRGTKR